MFGVSPRVNGRALQGTEVGASVLPNDMTSITFGLFRLRIKPCRKVGAAFRLPGVGRRLCQHSAYSHRIRSRGPYDAGKPVQALFAFQVRLQRLFVDSAGSNRFAG